jgi:nucleoside 2-deoxyribosyltransferase
MIIIGGTYDEYCFEPRWEQKFGSGLRACRVINSLNPTLDLDFYTFGDDNTKLFLTHLKKVFPKINCYTKGIHKTISFYYDHPLINPRVFPRPDTIKKENNLITVKGKDILYFGFIEGNAKVEAESIVYDPQSPSNPISFSNTGSKTKTLVYVVNFTEAALLAKSYNLTSIKKFFFNSEKADVVVLKMGPRGAMVITNKGKKSKIIPVYETSAVWPIGSGDVFAAAFSENWFRTKDPYKSAQKASLITAIHSEIKSFDFENTKKKFKPLVIKNLPKGQIYLAGPFFTYAERWLIDQIRSILIDMNLNVFSPWHDIGHDIASEVVQKDLKGLNKSKLIFAIIDGLDSGTLFEIGYAVSKKIPVIAYVENESDESLKMLEGTNCILEKDLTTAIYKSIWLLSKNE